MRLNIPIERVLAIHNRNERGAMVVLDHDEAHDTTMSFKDTLEAYCNAVDDERKLFSVDYKTEG